jgi:AAT family amino acid transporter
MSEATAARPAGPEDRQPSAVAREAGLERLLTPRQLTMIAIGGAIGTGLFLGSGLAISYAGPGVILSYGIGVLICLVMMRALTEMAVVHPTAGSFGVFADLYVNPWAGFVVRYTYWFAQVVAIGGEVTAAAIYTRYWFPDSPLWFWATLYSTALVSVNLFSVKNFGEFEYWFAMIKVSAIVLFIVLGIGYVLFGFPGTPAVGLAQLTGDGGFLPNGMAGVFRAMLMVLFSFYGIEIIAVTAGEAVDPRTAVPKAMRSVVVRLSLFYILAIALVVAIVPWRQAGIAQSPFVLVFRAVGIPFAAGIMNFVVLTAALSSMNTNLYLAGRMLFSLSRAGYAPARFGRLSRSGSPRLAILTSTVGLAVAALLSGYFPSSVYLWCFGVAIFGGLLVWIVVLLALLGFRRTRARSGLPPSPLPMPGYPWLPIAGIAALVLILVDCFFVGLTNAWVAGALWLAAVSIGYLVHRRRAAQPPERTTQSRSPSVEVHRPEVE